MKVATTENLRWSRIYGNFFKRKARKGKQKKQYEELMDLTPTKKVAGNKKRPLEQKDNSTKTSNLSGEPPKKKPKKNNKFKFPENVKPKLRPEPQAMIIMVAPPRTLVTQHKADPAEEKMPKEIEEEVVDSVSTEDDTEETKPKTSARVPLQGYGGAASVLMLEEVFSSVAWVNKQRVLTLSSRGILPQHRHLMLNLRSLLPHSKPGTSHLSLSLVISDSPPSLVTEPKRDPRTPLYTINELCEQKSCNKCLYFTSKNKSLYLWVANVPEGPSAKFLVESCKLAAIFEFNDIMVLSVTWVQPIPWKRLNCRGIVFRGAMPCLPLTSKSSHLLILTMIIMACTTGGGGVYSKSFEKLPQYSLVRELFTQVFATPRGHPRSKHCVDHVLSFALIDNRIWFRNFQILEEGQRCEEIGPRMVLNLVKIYSGSFEGACLYSNPHYHKLKQAMIIMVGRKLLLGSLHCTNCAFVHIVTKTSEVDVYRGSGFQRIRQRTVIVLLLLGNIKFWKPTSSSHLSSLRNTILY
ncbi:BRIX1 [Cordylochernes scorpioides]|uniref:Ribosome biogenesis protein BRX1 homolog n=1 Tax=Cordylochernes scorpioides TaxID=51811 RepID=A0ABY6KA72_9ARAC|nr:BRIX1 [Cordylochernes scorpioides]